MFKIDMFKVELAYARLLAIIANKLGYDIIMLSHDYSKPLNRNVKDIAILKLYDNYDIEPLLNTDGNIIEIEYVDCNKKLKDIKDSYKELITTLYRILDSGGVLKCDLKHNEKSKKNSIIAADVPEFMIKCVLYNLV